MQIDVVIASKNGFKHLKECLPTVVAAARNFRGTAQIIVVDDNSQDETLQMGPALFPAITFVKNPKSGVCSARNFGARQSKGTWLCFLDNDVFLEPEFFNTAAKYLRSEAFCVACAGYKAAPAANGRLEPLDGVKLIYWKHGFPRFTQNIYNQNLPKQETYFSWGVQGAYFFCQRAHFEQLGGFDELFDPYMLEETDLAYRGLKRGWKIVYAPDTRPRHKCGGTIQSKTNPYTKFLSKRNRTLFVWKNVQDPLLRLSHALRFCLQGPRLWQSCLKKYPEIKIKARAERQARTERDAEILEQSALFAKRADSRRWLRQRLQIKAGLNYLSARLARYAEKYHTAPQIALHLALSCLRLMWWRTPRPNTTNAPLQVCLTFEGGLGDLLIGLNWACAFEKRWNTDYSMQIDVCFQNPKMVTALAPAFVRHISAPRTQNAVAYDLQITCIRVPVVQYAAAERLPAPLAEYVSTLLAFEKEHAPLIALTPYKDALTQNIFSPCIKRWHQPDWVDAYHLQEKFLWEIPLIQEEDTLTRFELTTKKFITVNREVGFAKTTESTKLWPLNHYRQLIDLLKQAYPAYTLVEVGCGRGQRLGNTHSSLVGKTSLEEIKVLLKHAALHIDCDGGLVHLRHALQGGPSCVFFGPTSAEVFGYSENINLSSQACPIHCEFYSKTWQERCMLENPVCLANITAQTALERIQESGVLTIKAGAEFGTQPR